MKTGDLVRSLIDECVKTKCESLFIRQLDDGTLPEQGYLEYIKWMYPVVTNFCWALNRMIALFEPPLDTSTNFMEGLFRQAVDEGRHNGMWRKMLEQRSIDHVTLAKTYRKYKYDCGGSWKRYGDEYIDILRSGVSVPQGVYPDAPFPEPVLAMTYFQQMMTLPGNSPWPHFANQCATEGVILDVVDEHIYPAVLRSVLNTGDASTKWWKEHSKLPGEGGKESDEVRHLSVAMRFLNEQVAEDSGLQKDVQWGVATTMRLFAATMLWHDGKRKCSARAA